MMMNRNNKVLACALACLGLLPAAGFAQPAATEQEPQFYVGGHAGWTEARWEDEQQWRARIGLGNNVELDGSVEYDDKFEAGLQVGREYENYRLELEYQQGRLDLERINLGNLTEATSGTGRYEALSVNAYRMEDLTERFSVFAGLGIGWVRTRLPTMGFTGGCQCFSGAENDDMFWQARLGFDYRIREDIDLGLQYSRLFDVPGPASATLAPGIRYEGKDIDTLAIALRKRL